MSATEDPEVGAVTPSELFESIGDKVVGLALAANDDTVTSDEDERNPVEEIGSMCMNCGKNVSRVPCSNRRECVANHGKQGRHATALNCNPVLSRSYYHVFLL